MPPAPKPAQDTILFSQTQLYGPLQYNGIRIDIVKLKQYTREAVYSGPQYLYTKHTLVLTGTINPGETSYALPNINTPAGGPANPSPPTPQPPFGGFNQPIVQQPVQTPKQLAVVTDNAIRHALMAPRRQLRYDVMGALVLYSPLVGYSTDCNNGPKPLFCNLTYLNGPRTWVVDYGVEVAVNEAVMFNDTNYPPVLSQIWTAEVDIDEHFFTTRTIRGHVVFRSDQLLAANPTNVVDDWRKSFFHPIPTNFKRDKIYVRANDDGLSLDYVIVDRERALNINPAVGVTRIEAIQKIQVTSSGSEQQGADFLSHTFSKVQGITTDPIHDAGLLFNTITDVGKAAYSKMPVSVFTIAVKVWGNRQATRSNLTTVAIGLIAKRLQLFKAASAAGKDLSILHDLAGEYVEVSAVIISPPTSTFQALKIPTDSNKQAIVDSLNAMSGIFGASDSTPGFLDAQSGVTLNPAPAGDGLSRGTYMESLATAALKLQDDHVLTPPAFPAANAQTLS